MSRVNQIGGGRASPALNLPLRRVKPAGGVVGQNNHGTIGKMVPLLENFSQSECQPPGTSANLHLPRLGVKGASQITRVRIVPCPSEVRGAEGGERHSEGRGRGMWERAPAREVRGVEPAPTLENAGGR